MYLRSLCVSEPLSGAESRFMLWAKCLHPLKIHVETLTPTVRLYLETGHPRKSLGLNGVRRVGPDPIELVSSEE